MPRAAHPRTLARGRVTRPVAARHGGLRPIGGPVLRRRLFRGTFGSLSVRTRVGVGWLAAAAAAFLAGPDRAAAYVLLDGHWDTNNGPVEYTIATAGSDDIADDSEITAVERAFGSWECVLCSN